MEVIIVTGLSGAGKSNTMNYLEDMGYYCIDNMPPALIDAFINLEEQNKINLEKAAFVVDIRGGKFFDDLIHVLDELGKMGKEVKILFLEASEEALIRRFKETRRNHPLGEGRTTQEAIRTEVKELRDIRSRADYIIDTTNLKPAQLQRILNGIVMGGEGEGNTGFAVLVQSFGYKHGMPPDTDIVFDVRFIPNPFYFKSMKNLTGNSKKVREYVMRFDETKEFIKKLEDLIEFLVPYYQKHGKSHLTLAFGCTGGQHRSVAMANEFSDIFKKKGIEVTTVHRDVDKHQSKGK